MFSFLSILGDPRLWIVAFIFAVFSNGVSALPMPKETSSAFYAYAFKFLNGLAQNLSRAFAGKLPGV